MDQRVEPDDILRRMRDGVKQKEDARNQKQWPRQDRPDHLPHCKPRDQISVQRANTQRQSRSQGKALRNHGRIGQGARIIDHQNSAEHQIAHHRLRHRVDRKPRQQRIKECDRRVGQQSLGKQQGCRDAVAHGIEHHEGQNAGGIKNRKVRAKRRRIETHRKDHCQKNDATHRFQHRPQIPAGRSAIGGGHFAQHQCKHRPPGGEPATCPVCGPKGRRK